MDEKHYISKEKKQELEAELAELKGPKRKAVLDTLAFAKSLGDLSENAEYHNARDEQAKLEERVAHIETILKHAVIVTKHTKDFVSIASTVTVQKVGEKEKRSFLIVGSEEADMAAGKLSNTSPLGSALMTHKVGDIVACATPRGEMKYKIVEIA